tara:strand:+ start:764 stop:961 length:198 start_codon:yes stop_codon:yes gene_type:complete
MASYDLKPKNQLPDGSLRDARKCIIHNAWMRKKECPICYLEQKKAQRLFEQEAGSNKPEIKITKI